jgi:RHS repeat-associated protein
MPRFIWGVLFALLLAPAAARAQSEEVIYYHTDAIGSVRMITDSSGTVLARYDYTPFGQPWNPPGMVEVMQFTGQERELQTELDYFNARDFMSLTGRFTTPDDPAYMDPFNEPLRLYI